MSDLDRWLRSGRYLPPRLRDFHAQKDVFKALAPMLEKYQQKTAKHYEALRNLSWPEMQMATIDVFLWFMAMHGYTLQPSRAAVTFRNLDEAIEAEREASRAALSKILGQALGAS